MRLPYKIVKADSIALNALIKRWQIATVEGWQYFVTDTVRGRCYTDKKCITIPLWAFEDHRRGYLHYYICHETAHVLAPATKGNVHGSAFMEAFKMLCPEEYWHYELGYKPRNAAAAGIRKPE